MKAPLAGGALTPSLFPTLSLGIAVDATSVYWTNYDDSPVSRYAVVKEPLGAALHHPHQSIA